MGETTKIQWSDHTFSPWVGCAKVSAGCKNCYAEIDNPARIARWQGLELWGVDAARKAKAESGWREPEKWFRKAVRDGVRRRVFCASQCDVFEDRRDVDVHRERLWWLIDGTAGRSPISAAWDVDRNALGAGIDWLLLTKRPEHIMRLIPERWRAGLPPNVWVGTSVEDQAAADERIPHLLRVPARVRFLSCEPLLGPVQLPANLLDHHDRAALLKRNDRWGTCVACPRRNGIVYPEECELTSRYDHQLQDDRIHWIIIGGESGPKARPCDVAWVRDLVAQCRAAGCAPFVKQLGTRPQHSPPGWDAPCRPDGIHDSHGGDPAEWPADLRDERHLPIVRQPGAAEPPALSHHVEEALGP